VVALLAKLFRDSQKRLKKAEKRLCGETSVMQKLGGEAWRSPMYLVLKIKISSEKYGGTLRPVGLNEGGGSAACGGIGWRRRQLW